MKIVFTVIFCALLSASIDAQTISISGNIKDIKSSSPIENAKVQIKNLSNGSVDTVFSDIIGNWQYDILTSVENESQFLPKNLEVYQNFPNPFNPSTKINFSIPTNENVTILVHNILGELIDQKSIFLSAGNYVIDWFSKGSAGVYFYTISYANQSITNKMIQLDGGNGIGLGEIRTGIAGNFTKNIGLLTFNVELVTTKFAVYLQTIHSKYTLIDLHNDVLEVMVADPTYHLADLHNFNHTDIPRLQQGEVDVQFFSVWVSEAQYQNRFEQALVMRDLFYSELASNSGAIAQARTMQEALNINSQGKIAAVIGVEGGYHIENSIDKLVTLYNAGMRYMTITWNNSTDWAVAASDSRTLTDGLTEFGRQVIRKLDSLGVIIDVSHVGIKSIQDILEVTNNPIIASHSGVRALRNSTRNLYDWQMQDIAKSGGVIGVVFYPPFLVSPTPAYISDVIKHIDYIVNLVGTDYVAIGSDFDGIGTNVVQGLEDVSKFPDLTLVLLQHGYTELEVAKFLGGNFKRVFEQVCGN